MRAAARVALKDGLGIQAQGAGPQTEKPTAILELIEDLL